MFRGLHHVSVDAKGRMSLPARIRDELLQYEDMTIVVTIDPMSPCLLMYPISEWELIQAKLDKLPTFQPQARRLQRLLVGHATDLDIDKAGRVLLPAPLREFAQLDKKIALIGQGKKIEVWRQDLWETQRDQYLEQSDESEQQLNSIMDISL